MQAIVSLLDKSHRKIVNEIQRELEERFNVHKKYELFYPHFSYQVAEVYEKNTIEPVLRLFAAEMKDFTVIGEGLGLFTGTDPVIYIPVVRSHTLTKLHRQLWEEISFSGAVVNQGVLDFYHPDRWMPHITLAQGGISKGKLPAIVKYLNEIDLHWEISVNNIALITDTGSKHELKFCYERACEISNNFRKTLD